MIDLDGTENKKCWVQMQSLPANAKGYAMERKVPLYQHIADLNGTSGQ